MARNRISRSSGPMTSLICVSGEKPWRFTYLCWKYPKFGKNHGQSHLIWHLTLRDALQQLLLNNDHRYCGSVRTPSRSSQTAAPLTNFRRTGSACLSCLVGSSTCRNADAYLCSRFLFRVGSGNGVMYVNCRGSLNGPIPYASLPIRLL
jgi:hypothetical protein